MYTITVDGKDLYIPDSEDYQVSSATISINTDSVAYLDMDIPCTNKGLKEIKQQASIVRVYDNDVLRYKMFVDNIDYDFDNTAKVSCTSVLAYLKDSLVRPYSTVDSEEGITAPSSVNGYFSWLIEQHIKTLGIPKSISMLASIKGLCWIEIIIFIERPPKSRQLLMKLKTKF